MAMTWRTALFSILTVAFSATPFGSSAQRAKSDQEILMQLERDWDTAFHRRDVATIANILADEFLITYGDGTRGDRAKELKLAAEFDQQIDSSILDDFTIKIYGGTAVVWFTLRQTGPSKGKPLTVVYNYIDVFVLRAGRWQCVASQSTKVTAS